jgi:hypothetical protein
MTSSQNPYQGTVTETYKPDGSRQANIKGPEGNSMQVNQGADGNVAITKTETVDFSKVMPFTSLQPAAAAMDQIFGTKMARAMPSQKDLIAQYRQLGGQEADPMADIKRRFMEAQIKKMEGAGDGLTEYQRRSLAQKEKLQAAQIKEKEESAKQKVLGRVTKYSDKIKKSGIPQVTEILKGISSITSKHDDLPGQGAGQFVPGMAYATMGDLKGAFGMDNTQEVDAVELRAQMQKLMNLDLKERSGAAVTAQELKRLKQEYATYTDKELRSAMGRIQKALAADMKNLNTGAGPDVVNEYTKTREGEDFEGVIRGLSFSPGAKVTPGVDVMESEEVFAGPPVGTIEDGMRFVGGNPADQKNWVPVSQAAGGR